MNREIKFRAWDTFNKRMIQDPHKFRPTGHYERQHFDDPRYDAPFQYYEDMDDERDGVARPCHIMQFTGLKDKNENEIYEGDIILVNGEKRMPVVYENACFRTPYGASSYRLGGWEQTSIEVIGNLFQHPELIPTKEP